MAQNKKAIWGIVAIVALAATAMGGYAYYQKKKALAKDKPTEPLEPNNDIEPSKPKSNGGSTTTSNDNFPLKKGSKGANVTQLQSALNEVYGEKLSTDGDFGNGTLAVVSKRLGRGEVTQAQLEALVRMRGSVLSNANFQNGTRVTVKTTFFAEKGSARQNYVETNAKPTFAKSGTTQQIKQGAKGVVEFVDAGFAIIKLLNADNISYSAQLYQAPFNNLS